MSSIGMTCFEESQNLTYARSSATQRPVHQTMNPTAPYGANVHFCPSSRNNNSTTSSGNHIAYTDRSRVGNNLRFEGAGISRAIHIPRRPANPQNQPFETDIFSASWNDGSADQAEAFAHYLPATEMDIGTTMDPSTACTSYFLPQEPSLEEDDFSSLFQNIPPDGFDIFMPDSSMFDGQPVSGDDLTTPKTLLEAKTPGSSELWPSVVTNYESHVLDGTTSPQHCAAQGHPDPGLGYSQIHHTFTPPQLPGFDLSSLNYPPLPELPSSGDDQFDFQSGPSAFTTDQYLPIVHYQELESASAPDQSAQYPDLWASETAIQSPTGPTNISTPQGRHLGVKGGQRDTSKDMLLVQMKDQGLSYKVIKERLKFEEAESTLRGRYRALTKPREARLRKPEWGDQDIRLLFEAVSHCSKSTSVNLNTARDLDAVSIGQFVNKVPWKQVAEYMASKGAYRYGNATVKKKYLEVLKTRGAPV
ncbi:uncharacterized protein Z520_05265 [Fonsecaea multimorphosa CBS 102226]|uniref:Myb-like domain-containing protein n=1 Tax=Fonsecaea multimorphosa CBS 102226 TaxID=1442371 RepID=A0A0D2K6L5_9EURO|nr:uncharacterized protein Z520_05265 [Fonsecaea multimorphosa CBS 102226]KIX98804.1 hypothetical protein Z520_05265 [Fonsecaea multimorphosa CBS 102226]OAL25085.1 hypothetical protein AYO22_04962 [Fonsecaea multimorphosa]